LTYNYVNYKKIIIFVILIDKVQYFKNILIILITSVFFLSSNGFIFERYLCFSCNLSHNEVAFFEFGELKHNHPDCQECTSEGHVCDCSGKTDEHEENSEITYYSLEVLFQDNYKTELKQVPIEKDINIFGLDIFKHICLGLKNNQIIHFLKLLKIPPVLSSPGDSISLCSIFSVFRL